MKTPQEQTTTVAHGIFELRIFAEALAWSALVMRDERTFARRLESAAKAVGSSEVALPTIGAGAFLAEVASIESGIATRDWDSVYGAAETMLRGLAPEIAERLSAVRASIASQSDSGNSAMHGEAISDPVVARIMLDASLEVTGVLDRALAALHPSLSEDDASQLRLAIGSVLGHLHYEVVRPLWKQHPELQPAPEPKEF
jgi:hypothetical protein